MPVVSAHCFANHKGGVGKTTLCYQISAQYAAAHPDIKVLVADFTAAGDVSELLLGGVHEDRGRKALNGLVALSNTTSLCLKALTAATLGIDGLGEVCLKLEAGATGSEATQTSLVQTVLEHMPRSKKAKLAAESRVEEVGCRGEAALDLCEFALPVHKVNARVPSNLYLCPSGADFEPPISFSKSQQRRIVSVLHNCFKYADGEWKVFIDTDAAYDGGSEVYTDIALSISDFCLLPLHADVSEWLRARTTFGVVRDLREQGISECTVQMVLWNKLSVRSSRHGFCYENQICAFTPTKAEQDMVRTLYHLVFELASQHPADFFNFSVENPADDCFKPAACMRHLTVVGLASKDVGVPVATIHAGVFHGVHMTYNLSQYSIDRCRDNLSLIVEGIDKGDELLRTRKGPRNQAAEGREGQGGRRDQQAPEVHQGQAYIEMQEREDSGVGEPRVEECAGSLGPGVGETSTSEAVSEDIEGGERAAEEREACECGEHVRGEMTDGGAGQTFGVSRQSREKASEENNADAGSKEVKAVKRRGSRYQAAVFKSYSLRNQYSLRSRSCEARFSLHADGRPWMLS